MKSIILAQNDVATPAADQAFPLLSNLVIQYGPNLARIFIVLLIVLVAYALARRSINLLVTRRRLSQGIALIINRLLFWAGVLVVLLYALQALNVLQDAWTTLTAILAMVAIGFVAVWSVLSNLLCSFILLIARPFMVGDTIEVLGEPMKGRVVDFTLLYTILEHEQGGLIRIPNNLFFQKAIHVTEGKNQIPLDQQIDQEQPQT